MVQRIIVSFGGGRSCTLEAATGDIGGFGEDEARAWLADAFDALGCEPSNPMGKVLVVDLVLGVARAAGEQGFAARPDWAKQYAAAVARLRNGPAMEVDVAAWVVRQGESG